MFRKVVFLVAFFAVGFLACDTTCSEGAVCGDNNFVGANPIPSPSPVPLPNATPDPCRIEAVQVGFFGGEQIPFVGINVPVQIDATPMNSTGEVPKGCNASRTPSWQVLTPTTCQLLSSSGNPYTPYIRGLKVGSCTVSATVSNVTGSMTVEVQ